MDYLLRLIEPDGSGGFNTIIEDSKPAFTDAITRALNGIGSAKFAVSRYNDAWLDALATNRLYREVQIYREDQTDPIWWGIPYHPNKAIGSNVYEFQCAEVIPWLLSRRNFGKANRTNLLTNAQFESGLTGWTTTGVGTATTSADAVLGALAAELIDTDSLDGSVQQSFSFTAGSIGDLLPAAAWFKIDTYSGPSFSNRGLYVEYRLSGVLKDVRYTIIDGSTPQGKWTRAELAPEKTLWIPPNQTVTVNLRGYKINGTIKWDAMFIGTMESTSTLPGGTDIATFAQTILAHAMDSAYGKDQLWIGASCPAVGYTVVEDFPHAEHGNIWNTGMRSLIDRELGIDVGWSYTPTSRTFHTYDRVFGFGKGTDNTVLDLTMGGAYVVDYGNGFDGNTAANNMTMLGDGNDPTREEGSYIDLTKFGGRSFEEVRSAPAGSGINSLDQRARKAGRLASNPTTLDLVLRPRLPLDTLVEGDLIAPLGYDAMVELGYAYRITDWALNTLTDAVTVTSTPLGV